jgi:hypothetical protein
MFASFDEDAIVVAALGLEQQLADQGVDRDGARGHQP